MAFQNSPSYTRCVKQLKQYCSMYLGFYSQRLFLEKVMHLNLQAKGYNLYNDIVLLDWLIVKLKPTRTYSPIQKIQKFQNLKKKQLQKSPVLKLISLKKKIFHHKSPVHPVSESRVVSLRVREEQEQDNTCPF